MDKFNLDNESLNWVKSGIVSSEQREEILSLYNKDDEVVKSKRYDINLIRLSLYILAGVTMALGIIALVSVNWWSFGSYLRIMFSVLPLVISGVVCIYAYIRDLSDGFKVFATIVNIGAVMSSIALIGQVFHLQGSWTSYSITVCILILPMYFCFYKSKLTILVVMAFLLSMASFLYNEMFFIFTFEKVAIYLLLLMCIYLVWEEFEKEESSFTLAHLFLFLNLCIILVLYPYNSFYKNMSFDLISYKNNLLNDVCIFVASIRFYIYILERFYKNGVEKTVILFKRISTFLIIYTIGINILRYNEITIQPFFDISSIIVLVTLILCFLLDKKSLKEKLCSTYDIFYLGVCFLLLFVNILGNITLSANIVFFLIIVRYLFIFKENRDYNLLYNIIKIIGAYILIKFAMSSASIMSKSIILISVSAITLVINKKLGGRKYEK